MKKFQYEAINPYTHEEVAGEFEADTERYILDCFKASDFILTKISEITAPSVGSRKEQ